MMVFCQQNSCSLQLSPTPPNLLWNIKEPPGTYGGKGGEERKLLFAACATLDFNASASHAFAWTMGIKLHSKVIIVAYIQVDIKGLTVAISIGSEDILMESTIHTDSCKSRKQNWMWVRDQEWHSWELKRMKRSHGRKSTMMPLINIKKPNRKGREGGGP